MDDWWKQLRWIVSWPAWVAMTDEVKIVVSAETFDEHLNAFLSHSTGIPYPLSRCKYAHPA